jgi:peptidoglycan/LPS O-acetylase OafA/YrhL
VVILIVLAFHSVLAYLDFLPAKPYPFDAPPFEWQAFPIIDSRRWMGFDLFCAWQDVYLMSFMFFLSGLFVWSSLIRKGSGKFLADRFRRIGLPLIVVVLLVMPIAYYPTYRVSAADPSVAAYWQAWWALPFWPSGPLWFLWQLLLFDLLAAGLFKFAPQAGSLLAGLAASARTYPLRYFFGLVAVSAVAYVPLALIFSPWKWTHFGAFDFQMSRPLHYLVYFLAGLGIGAYGLDRGLLSTEGGLGERWGIWLAAALASLLVWMGFTSLTLDDGDKAPIVLQFAANVSFVVACASGCFFFVAVFLRFGQHRSAVYDGLSESAYGMYLVHYVFVVWMQYALLDLPLFAIVKAAIVFSVTLLLSWGTTIAVQSAPFGVRLIGSGDRHQSIRRN